MSDSPHSEGPFGAEGPHEARAERLYEHSRQVRAEATELASALTATVSELEGYLREELTQRPYATLGIAAGMGFVLGGGLASPIGRTLIRMAGRAALSRLVQSSLEPRSAAVPPEGL